MSFETKHNEANGEGNRDGHGENFSWNSGVEGETDSPSILAARRRDLRALLSTLFAARGTIMLSAGEFGRSQRGNNNAYAQDNETTWPDWTNRDADLEAHVGALLPCVPEWASAIVVLSTARRLNPRLARRRMAGRGRPATRRRRLGGSPAASPDDGVGLAARGAQAGPPSSSTATAVPRSSRSRCARALPGSRRATRPRIQRAVGDGVLSVAGRSVVYLSEEPV